MGLNLTITGLSFVLLGLMGLTEIGSRGWSALQQRFLSAAMLIMAVLATMLGGMRGGETTSLVGDPVRLIRMFVLGVLLLVSVAKILKQSRSWHMAGFGLRAMAWYGAFAMFSALYSVQPLMSAYKAAEVIALVLAGIAIAAEIRGRQDLDWLISVFTMILLFLAITVLLGVVMAPGTAFRPASAENPDAGTIVVGVLGFINPASVGGFGALLVVIALPGLINPKERVGQAGYWLVLAMGTAVMILAHVRTAILGVTVAVVLMLVYARRLGLALGLGALGAAAALLTALGDVVTTYITRGQSQELFLSMSGRTYYWGLVWDKFLEAPILGHGFYAIRALFVSSSADNTYLQVLMELGIVGLAFLSAPVLYMAWTLYRLRPRGSSLRPEDWLWIKIAGLATVIITRSIAGTSFHILHHMLTFFVILLLATAGLQRAMAHLRLADRQRRSTEQSDEERPGDSTPPPGRGPVTGPVRVPATAGPAGLAPRVAPQ